MKQIDSDALDVLARIMGIAGATGATLLDDDNVSQVLQVNEIVRRSRTLGVSTGLYHATFVNIHLAAGDLVSTINMFEAGGAARAPYPAAIGLDLDLYILYASLTRSAGVGTLDGAVLSLNPAPTQMAWGIDDMGAAVVEDTRFAIAGWSALDSSAAGFEAWGISGDGRASVDINRRIGRGSSMGFFTTAAGAAATFRLHLTLGLFTEGLGQDVAQ